MTDRIRNSGARLEDRRLLTGGGRFVDTMQLEGMAHAAFVRSPVAHAAITRVETGQAECAEGVLAVYTARDLEMAGVGPMECWRPIDSYDGTPFKNYARPVLAGDRVRHVGEPVVMVVARSAHQALDAAELIEFDFEELDAVVDPEDSDDIAFTWRRGDFEATDSALASAHRVIETSVRNNRVAPASLEPRSALGVFEKGRYTLHTQTQGVHAIRRAVSRTLGVSEEHLRVVTPDVGGSFGMKLVDYPEQVCVLFAAQALGRPVRWVSSRAEAFLSDAYGRDHRTTMKLAVSRDGNFEALRVGTRGNLGAYPSAVATTTISLGFAKVLGGVYEIPAIALEVEGVYTNTTPTDAYRGAGKPEAIYALERLIDKAAAELGVDRVELRRRNLVRPEQMPYDTALGFTYEKSDFPAVLEKALAAGGWEDGPPRRGDAHRRYGKGLGSFVHLTGATATERTRSEFTTDGRLVVRTGSQSSGQAHQTTFTQLIAARFGLPADMIEIVQGDSDALTSAGSATGGSSSLQCAGTTMIRAVEKSIEALRGVAADYLEISEADIEFDRGGFRAAGTDHRVGIAELLRSADRERIAACARDIDFEGELATLPNGMFVADVSVEADTGRVTVERLVCVSDVGRRLNTVILDGQLVGAAAQGLGQALLEDVRYEPETGQLLTGSLMDYALPRAGDMPRFSLLSADLPSEANFLGMKGAGELGCIGAPAAIVNAIADAIGTQEIDMPATPERVWRALSNATRNSR